MLTYDEDVGSLLSIHIHIHIHMHMHIHIYSPTTRTLAASLTPSIFANS